jgi:hypothetical protein
LRATHTYLLLILILLACGKKSDLDKIKAPKKVAQWINPNFYNNDFEDELNFPLWFDDSLIRAHQIYKITKQIYPRIHADTTDNESQLKIVPKEKIEYYFDPNGLVDQIVIYSYFDDREISRANFIYEGNMLSSGFRNVRTLPLISLTKKNEEDEFTTELYQEELLQHNLLKFVKKEKKYAAYINPDKGNFYFSVKNRKYWGPLSIDSILHPKKEDWVIHGSLRKPYKKYHVENIVNESLVHKYYYHKTGVLKRRTKKTYPFEFRRYYFYDTKHAWKSYLDSTFSGGQFISKMENKIIYDEFQRPVEIKHQSFSEEKSAYSFKETLHYRTKNKNHNTTNNEK